MKSKSSSNFPIKKQVPVPVIKGGYYSAPPSSTSPSRDTGTWGTASPSPSPAPSESGDSSDPNNH